MSQVRIEGGAWKGRRLEVPNSKNLRPSSSKTKLAIFNILEAQQLKLGRSKEFLGLSCLDLYAGVGALGFEALSRGAERAVFVERDRQQLKALRNNSITLACEAQTTIVAAPVEKSWSQLRSLAPFDLVFMDPPYADHGFVDGLVELVPLLNSEAWVIIEHDPKLLVGAVDGLECQSTRSLGPAGISVYRKLS